MANTRPSTRSRHTSPQPATLFAPRSPSRSSRSRSRPVIPSHAGDDSRSGRSRDRRSSSQQSPRRIQRQGSSSRLFDGPRSPSRSPTKKKPGFVTRKGSGKAGDGSGFDRFPLLFPPRGPRVGRQLKVAEEEGQGRMFSFRFLRSVVGIGLICYHLSFVFTIPFVLPPRFSSSLPCQGWVPPPSLPKIYDHMPASCQTKTHTHTWTHLRTPITSITYNFTNTYPNHSKLSSKDSP
ncbi:hypothetical protein BDZ85DRAFT_248627 [Elsinoe ampelina]|uniref:Transmembrane protein n=1 Tax=Elsinoe ampelina TaxID=302913 RepID=A0A6A6GHQ3_9PEZI|nr:hypothetical protein BDZ85DRAFT_248627 [Elsinoe ampelina]